MRPERRFASGPKLDYMAPLDTNKKPTNVIEKRLKEQKEKNETLTNLGNRKVFYPVTREWQDEKSKLFKLKVMKQHRYGSQKVFYDKSAPKETVSVQPDGNCFFRALSCIVTGSEDDHLRVREAITKHISDHPDMYRTFLMSRGGMTDYLTTMRRPKEWATDVEILATATFLKSVVEVYFPCRMSNGNTEYSWQTFKPLNNIDITYPAIYICNKNEHFDPVMDVDPHQTSKTQAVRRGVSHKNLHF